MRAAALLEGEAGTALAVAAGSVSPVLFEVGILRVDATVLEALSTLVAVSACIMRRASAAMADAESRELEVLGASFSESSQGCAEPACSSTGSITGAADWRPLPRNLDTTERMKLTLFNEDCFTGATSLEPPPVT